MNTGLLQDLTRLLGSGNVSTDGRHLDDYAGDALGDYRAFGAVHRLDARPEAVAWPTTTKDVSHVLKLANRLDVPVVPYGGGTGVMGAAVSNDDCIVLNLQRMDRVCRVSRRDMTIRAQAGVVLESAAAALRSEGLLLGHDPWSRPIATVGGALSTNGVGYTAAKYGPMGDQAMGLEAVLPDGEIVRTQEVPKRSYGPSLAHLLIGTEGTLGVITEATLRAFPLPERRILRAIEFPSFEAGFEAVVAMYAEGVQPAMLDYGEELWRDGESVESDATVYLGVRGFCGGSRSARRQGREDLRVLWAGALPLRARPSTSGARATHRASDIFGRCCRAATWPAPGGPAASIAWSTCTSRCPCPECSSTAAAARSCCGKGGPL